ncbi:hypothetical protein HRI_003166600 [Hibiscus trionum]|uniref:Uncharacterized protein n=1 Tax=Hibiscus trionum TaxID=183268 RepID=A0A9W7IIT1_HIBTR|nr:hypothetical protein HRI_003166600 [Hibiscus trionum]
MAMEPQLPPQKFLTWLNSAVANSRAEKHFKLAEQNSTFTTELRAGTITSLTMACIFTVNASILADSGGPCSVSDCVPLCFDPSIPLFNFAAMCRIKHLHLQIVAAKGLHLCSNLLG